mgnify:CR=1 FL=1
MKILGQVKIVDGWLIQIQPIRFLGYDLNVIGDREDNRSLTILKVRHSHRHSKSDSMYVICKDSNVPRFNRYSTRYIIRSAQTQKSQLEKYQMSHEYKQIDDYFYRIPRTNDVYVSEKGSKKYVVLWMLLSELLDTRNLVVNDIVTLDRLNYESY